jgi:hypothetical protein
MTTNPSKAGAAVAVMLISLVPIACSAGIFDTGHPLDATLEVEEATGQVGDEFRFLYEVQGSSLERITFTFGDGETQVVETLGAHSAGGWRDHAYDEAGSYEVRMVVREQSGAELAREVTVEVEPAP